MRRIRRFIRGWRIRWHQGAMERHQHAYAEHAHMQRKLKPWVPPSWLSDAIDSPEPCCTWSLLPHKDWSDETLRVPNGHSPGCYTQTGMQPPNRGEQG